MSRLAVWLGVLALSLPGASGAAGKPSFDDLIASLKSSNAKTRQDAVAALGKSRRREAIAPLAALVRDPEPKVRLEVVRALREMRDLSAIPALVTQIGDGDPRIRQEAIGTIVEVYAERERSTPISRFLDMFSDEYDRASVGPYVKVDASVFRALGTALSDEDKDIRESAALAAGILGGRGLVSELTAALQDPDSSVRGAAATAIGKVGSGEDGKALIPLLSDEASVRNRALQAIGVLRVKDAGPALRQLYEANRRREPGLKVLECLSRIADASQADLFRELAQDPEVEKRRLAVEGLGRISDPQMLSAFKKDYQRERNEEMRLAYAFSLTLLGDRAFLDTIVLGLPSKIAGSRCRRYLLELGREVLPDLYPYLNDPDEGVRSELCDLIATLGDPDAISRIEPLTSDPSAKVADAAVRAVERLRRTAGAAASPE